MIAALEGPIGLTECTVHPGACPQELSCHVREPWQRINQAVRATPSSPGSIVPFSSFGITEERKPHV